jgi:hypothetical protein
MSDDEKPLDLRDKLAVEILNGLLASGGVEQSGQLIHKYYSGKDEVDRERATILAERLIRTAYMMADIMRKVRLTAFT